MSSDTTIGFLKELARRASRPPESTMRFFQGSISAAEDTAAQDFSEWCSSHVGHLPTREDYALYRRSQPPDVLALLPADGRAILSGYYRLNPVDEAALEGF